MCERVCVQPQEATQEALDIYGLKKVEERLLENSKEKRGQKEVKREAYRLHTHTHTN